MRPTLHGFRWYKKKYVFVLSFCHRTPKFLGMAVMMTVLCELIRWLVASRRGLVTSRTGAGWEGWDFHRFLLSYAKDAGWVYLTVVFINHIYLIKTSIKIPEKWSLDMKVPRRWFGEVMGMPWSPGPCPVHPSIWLSLDCVSYNKPVNLVEMYSW